LSGRLAGLARRSARRAPMEEIDAAEVSADAGIAGDHKGARFKKR
jgi:hypothetical protein